MANEDPTQSGAEATGSQDRCTERAVLAFLLDQHPTGLTVQELSLALDASDFAEKDALTRAVRELTGAGLIRAEGDVVAPTRAALRFEQLESD